LTPKWSPFWWWTFLFTLTVGVVVVLYEMLQLG
jgi:hypothetical protein